MGSKCVIRLCGELLFAVLLAPGLPAQSVSLHVQPGASFSLPGSEFAYALVGVNANVGVDYQLPFAPFLVVNGALNYTMPTVETTGTALHLISVGTGAGVSTTPLDKLNLRLVGSGGWYEALYGAGYGGAGYYSVEAGASFALFPSLSLGLGASYTEYMDSPLPLYRGLKAWLGVSVNPAPARHTPRMEIPAPGIRITPIFPIFYKYFDTNPLGTVTITNNEKKPVGKVKVSFYIKDFMDGPKYSEEIPSMKPGESRDVNVYALLKDSVLNITEDTKVMALLKVSYAYEKEDLSVEKAESIRIYNRNAMTWEDDRRAAAFVTTKDPMVMKFSKSVNAMVRNQPTPAATLSFRIAMAMFEGLGLHGLRYNLNPKGSYAELSVNKYTVDYLQFPRQTLTYKGGDCSDISILYGALLESLDIETAFITVPGHIFLAFVPGVDPRDVKSVFSNAEDIIIQDDKAWIPVEITMVADGFLTAWEEGAREWRENVDTRGFYPMRSNWKVYEPVWMQGEEGSLPDIGGSKLSALYTDALAAFVNQEVGAREKAIQAEVARTNGGSSSLNKLGVLYARFGLTDKARAQFEKALGKGEYAPALINLGNILFVANDMKGALACYERARGKEPQNATALIGMAKVSYEMEKYDDAKAYYGQAVGLKPDLSKTYAFLAEKSTSTTRAASADARETVPWSEEEQ